MNKLLTSFRNKGFTDVFDTELSNSGKLDELKTVIYNLTKEKLIDHDSNISLNEKLQVPFKEEVSVDFLNRLHREINIHPDFQKIIDSEEVQEKFKLIFNNPVKYKFCVFRAKIPLNISKVYPWHQDEGSWYLFKDKDLKNKLMGIMWLSINGSDVSNSINLLEKSHLSLKLFRHSFVKGIGYFKARISASLSKLPVYRVHTKPGEAIIFHNLTFHKTSNDSSASKMVPRYSIDIRYYEKDEFLNYKVDFFYKVEGFLRLFNIKFRKDGL
jgi:hypothetical protein